jgi:hypothetical protein
MEEELKNDLAGIAFSHPFFSDIVTGVLNYIEKLEKENKELEQRLEEVELTILENDDFS